MQMDAMIRSLRLQDLSLDELDFDDRYVGKPLRSAAGIAGMDGQRPTRRRPDAFNREIECPTPDSYVFNSFLRKQRLRYKPF